MLLKALLSNLKVRMCVAREFMTFLVQKWLSGGKCPEMVHLLRASVGTLRLSCHSACACQWKKANSCFQLVLKHVSKKKKKVPLQILKWTSSRRLPGSFCGSLPKILNNTTVWRATWRSRWKETSWGENFHNWLQNNYLKFGEENHSRCLGKRRWKEKGEEKR